MTPTERRQQLYAAALADYYGGMDVMGVVIKHGIGRSTLFKVAKADPRRLRRGKPIETCPHCGAALRAKP